jgi:hypothetical protein
MSIANATIVREDGEESARTLGEVADASPRAFNDRWVLVFVLAGFVFELGLFLFGNTALRLPLRVGMYFTSLAFVFLIRGDAMPHPGSRLIQYILAVLIVCLINPLGNEIPARFAQICLYFSVLAPLIWASKLHISTQTFRRLVLIMWFFYTASAVMGVLQVEYPGKFDGALSANFDDQSIMPHVFVLADGTKIIRPKGLTDVPGGASTGGVYSIVLGTGLLLTSRSLLLRIAAISGMVAGLFCIFICQMRTNLIITGIATLSLIFVLLYRRDYGRAGFFLAIAIAVALVGKSAAFSVGGKSTVDRFLTLIASDPGTVFYANRGGFVDEVVHNATHEYPLGAGLGRWGMVSHYFGNPADSVWAEMMWQALLYDGGIPLMLLYIALIAVLLRTALRQALHQRDRDLACWGGVVFGYTLAALAATFVFPIFADSEGMDVLLLNAAFYAVCMTADAERDAAIIDAEPDESDEFENEPDFDLHTQPI